MGNYMDQDKLKAMTAELTKGIKTEKGLSSLTQQLVKLTVETALNCISSDQIWLSVLTELKNHGLEDVLIACVGGLKRFSDAIEAEYPKTKIQLCIVHMVRNSLCFVPCRVIRLLGLT